MRPIKFRAWDRYMKQMVKVKTLDFSPQGAECAVDYSDINGDIDGEWDLMEYTGLKDSEDVEIYEGDIVEIDVQEYVAGYERETLHTGVLEYDGEGMRYCLKPIGKPKLLVGTPPDDDSGISGWGELSWEPEYLDYVQQEDITVIGNIYENPELLEAHE
ncbi:hypothetical protein IWT25_00735 [Secundilactobacillus pentosiphilus]|uniref:YopX protein domain-containing protein n=1 Tax=Secundilactobacillus pentosiphilus TaxID=1714682 RepID=A0A1Z5IVG8_9LACO|nr:YopX family protein [Secundilactobacillus pentosiphilus]GAX05431.1 hypothetical protein IWT25_00735 [Secundilactobacillus pentosiphilus]